jgi:hypothetical protein
MEVGVAQSGLRDAIHSWSGYNAAEGTGRPEALVIGHDEQHIWSPLGRHHVGCPPWGRLGSLFLDDATEFWVGRRKLFAVYSRGGAGRSQNASDLLCRCREAIESNKSYGHKYAATDAHIHHSIAVSLAGACHRKDDTI